MQFATAAHSRTVPEPAACVRSGVRNQRADSPDIRLCQATMPFRHAITLIIGSAKPHAAPDDSATRAARESATALNSASAAVRSSMIS